jgi:imidazolonepropionase-like amidohydrolase
MKHPACFLPQNLLKQLWLLIFCILNSAFCISQTPTPAAPQTKSTLITGLVVHIGNGKVIENGAIGFKDGKLTLVADATTIKLGENSYDTSYALNGAHAYPAFFAPNTTLGITEVDAVRATNDYSEVGGYNPHVRSLIAFNTEGKVITTVRTNGVLYAQVTPRRGTIPGTSSVVGLDGWNWEDAVMKQDDGVHVNFPKITFRAQFNIEGPDVPTTGNTKYDEQVNELKKFFSDAKAYLATQPEEKNLRYEALRGVFAGTQNLYIHADFVKDMIAAINFVKQFELRRPVFVGGNDSWKISKMLRENKIPVMITRLHSLPDLDYDDVDQPYKLAYLLQKDSVQFCLQNAGDQEGQQARNMPFLAGTARAYGLSNEQAVAAVSYNTAKILGVDKEVGSLEAGKNASFFISTGDALDMRTNNVILAFINGKRLMLTNTQLEQYRRYSQKYGIKP